MAAVFWVIWPERTSCIPVAFLRRKEHIILKKYRIEFVHFSFRFCSPGTAKIPHFFYIHLHWEGF